MRYLSKSVMSIAERLSEHDSSTFAHCARVGIVSAAVLPGTYNGIRLDPISAFLGGYLHDVGKLKVPRMLLQKMELTSEEMEIIRQHPRQGVELIKNEFPELAGTLVFYIIGGHHEANGYPRRDNANHGDERRNYSCYGLLQKISIIDSFDAMTDNTRHYHEALSLEDAAKRLSSHYPGHEEFVQETFEQFTKVRGIIF